MVVTVKAKETINRKESDSAIRIENNSATEAQRLEGPRLAVLQKIYPRKKTLGKKHCIDKPPHHITTNHRVGSHHLHFDFSSDPGAKVHPCSISSNIVTKKS